MTTERPRDVHVIGTSVLLPYRSEPDQIIKKPSELTEILYKHDSIIGTLPELRVDPKRKKHSGRLLGDYFYFDPKKQNLQTIFDVHRPHLGWEPEKIRSPGESIGLTLAMMALESAGITPSMFDETYKWLPKGERDTKPLRVAIGVNNSVAQIEKIARAAREDLSKQSAFDLQVAGLLGHNNIPIIEALNSQGPAILIQAACATSLFQIDKVKMLFEMGKADIAVLVAYEIGADKLVPYLLGESLASADYDTFSSDPTQASRPGDINAAGMVMIEGGVGLVLITRKTMDRLHIPLEKSQAKIVGSATGQDPYRFAPKGPRELIRVLNETLEEAGLEAKDIDLVIPHGTGTKDNEINQDWPGLRTVFKLPKREFDDLPDDYHPDKPDTTEPKSSLGHNLAGSGDLSGLIAIAAIKDQKIPSTRNISIDPETGALRPHGMTFNLTIGENKIRTPKNPVKRVLVASIGIAGEVAGVLYEQIK